MDHEPRSHAVTDDRRCRLIGSKLVDVLLDRGDDVTIIDNLSTRRVTY
jgi:nucleoside-diphosphate-sugar epimerase